MAFLVITQIVCFIVFNVGKCDIPELEYLNTTVNPCDDFYEFTCGNFENIISKPEGAPIWDHFVILEEDIRSVVKGILESPESKYEPIALTKSKKVYKGCLNVDYSNKLNVPELGILEKMGNWPLISEWSYKTDGFSWNFVATLISTYGVSIFFNVDVKPNLYAAEESIIYISLGDILIPAIGTQFQNDTVDFLNVAYEKEGNPHPFKTFLTKIALHLRNKIGSYKSEQSIVREVGDIYNFMKFIQSDGIQHDKYNVTSQFKTVEELQIWTDAEFPKLDLNWMEFLNRVFSKSGTAVYPKTTVMITNMSVFYGLLNLIGQTDDAMLKNFAFALLFTHTSSDSNGNLRDAYEQFKNATGDPIRSRSHYCVKRILDYSKTIGLSMALTHQYQRYHFNVNKMAAIVEMIDDVNTAFVKIFERSDLLDGPSRIAALKKLDKMITLLGYPDFITEIDLLDRFYENVRVCEWDHFGNAQRLRAFGRAFNLALLGKRENRKVWQSSPLEVNAYYSRQYNRFSLPISMLNSVFFTGVIRALDYGRIGSIIGHEITHGYDNLGMYYNEDGNMTMDWWTTDTQRKYGQRKKCFLEQYQKYYIPEIDEYVNAVTTLAENMADNGGLTAAFRAFKELTHRKRAMETIEGYTPQQLFFIGFGTLWCTSQKVDYLTSIQNSNYPPARYRVIGAISNNKHFAEAFDCPVGSDMNPAKKCTLW